MANNDEVASDIFSWPEHLQRLNLTWDHTAPPANFNQNPNPPVNHFQPGYHLLVKVKEPNEETYDCLAVVLKTRGPRIRLQLEFTWKTFWTMCDSAILSPLDGSDMVGLGLHCPSTKLQILPEHFQKKLRKTLQRCKRASPEWFVDPPAVKPEKNLFRLGQKLEVADCRNSDGESTIWPGTIVWVKNHLITVSFDDWDQGDNLKLPYDSREIFPCGWAQRANHPMGWSDNSSSSASAGNSEPDGSALKKRKFVDAKSPTQDTSDATGVDESLPKHSATKLPRRSKATKSALPGNLAAPARVKFAAQMAADKEATSGTSDVDKTTEKTVVVEPSPTVSPRKFGTMSITQGNLSALAQARFVVRLSNTPNDNDVGKLRLDMSDEETDAEHNRKSIGSAEAEVDPIEPDGNFSSFSPSSPPGDIDDKFTYPPGSSCYSPTSPPYSPTLSTDPQVDNPAEQRMLELSNERVQADVNMIAVVSPNTSLQTPSAESVDQLITASDTPTSDEQKEIRLEISSESGKDKMESVTESEATGTRKGEEVSSNPSQLASTTPTSGCGSASSNRIASQPPKEITEESSVDEVVDWLKQFRSIHTDGVVEIFRQKSIDGWVVLELKSKSFDILMDLLGLQLCPALALSRWLQKIPEQQ